MSGESTALPSAQQQNPACGACHGETEFDGDCFICDDCGLAFDPDNLSASFVYSDSLPCGAGCGNTWHGDDRIRLGVGFDCGTCKLPTGHRVIVLDRMSRSLKEASMTSDAFKDLGGQRDSALPASYAAVAHRACPSCGAVVGEVCHFVDGVGVVRSRHLPCISRFLTEAP